MLPSLAVVSLALVKKSRDEHRVLDNQSHNGILHIKTVAVQNTIGRDDDDRTTYRRPAGVLIIATTVAWDRSAFPLGG